MIFTIMGVESDITGMLSDTVTMISVMARKASITNVTRSPNSVGRRKVSTERLVRTSVGIMMLNI